MKLQIRTKFEAKLSAPNELPLFFSLETLFALYSNIVVDITKFTENNCLLLL